MFCLRAIYLISEYNLDGFISGAQSLSNLVLELVDTVGDNNELFNRCRNLNIDVDDSLIALIGNINRIIG